MKEKEDKDLNPSEDPFSSILNEEHDKNKSNQENRFLNLADKFSPIECTPGRMNE